MILYFDPTVCHGGQRHFGQEAQKSASESVKFQHSRPNLQHMFQTKPPQIILRYILILFVITKLTYLMKSDNVHL